KFVQGNWTRPVTNNLLLQAGAIAVGGRILFGPSPDENPGDISVLNSAANYRYGSPTSKTHRYYSQANGQGSLSYVRASHTIKVGGSYMYANRREDPFVNQSISYTFSGASPGTAIPQSVTYYAYPINYKVELRLGALYAQDQWTIRNVTLNLGLRYDYLNGS